MLLALAKILLRFLALMAIIVAVLWWRSARHIDVLKFDWSQDSDHSISLISHAGGLHVDYTTLHPVSTLRHSNSWSFAFQPDNLLSPEVDTSTDHAHFTHLEEFQIRVPMQGLFQDLRHTQPVYQTETLPLKLISAPAWFVFAILAAPPLAWLGWRIRHRRPRKPSRILWLVRHPSLVAGIGAGLLILPWLRGCWRSDDLQCDIGRFHYVLGSTSGVFTLSRQNAGSIDNDYRGQHGAVLMSLSDADNITLHDVVLPPLEYQAETGWRFPYWIAMLALASFAIAGAIRRRLAPVFPKGHCQRCGYDLRASSERCPECGLLSSATLRRSERRVPVALALWLGNVLSLTAIVLIIGWLQGRSGEIVLFHAEGTRRVFAATEQSHIVVQSTWQPTNGGQIIFLDLPTWIFPAGLLIASFACFWIARSAAALRSG